MLGEKDKALAELQAAVDDGWRGFYGVDLSAGTNDEFYGSPGWRFDAKHDVLLDGIRDDPRFQQAFETIDADMNIQLASVRAMEQNGDLALPAPFTSDSVHID